MHIHGTGLAVVVLSPDFGQKLFAAERSSMMRKEELQQFEFLVGEGQAFAIKGGFVACGTSLRPLKPSSLVAGAHRFRTAFTRATISIMLKGLTR